MPPDYRRPVCLQQQELRCHDLVAASFGQDVPLGRADGPGIGRIGARSIRMRRTLQLEFSLVPFSLANYASILVPAVEGQQLRVSQRNNSLAECIVVREFLSGLFT